MWVQEKGTSADPADTSIACGCGARLSLQDLFTPGRLGKCVGERPWLLDRDPDGCDQNLKLLIRTATNTYFPQTLTVISLPAEEDELTSLVDQLSGDLANVKTVEHVAAAKQFNPKVSAALGAFGDADIFERLRRLREGVVVGNALPPKQAEFDVFASGRDEIGVNTSDAKLYARTLTRRDWDPTASTYARVIRSLVAVHRLREVSCLYGFTRFEAAPTTTDGDIEDVRLAVRGAPISKDADWLPAVELFGEGLFLHFDEAAIRAWLARSDVRERQEQLRRGYMSWVARYPGGLPDFPGLPYVLLHSLSHALMQEIALDCGYPASSLKERVYALKSPIGIIRSVRHPHLHGEHRGAGNAGRFGWHRAAVRRDTRERASPGRDMLKRPGLRRSRARWAKRRQGDTRRGLPWLLADRRDQLREQESVLGSSAACSDDAR